jgi:hypothetical protein
MDYIKDILTEIGYNLQDYGKEYRARPLYRESNNETILTIEKSTGKWYDFKDGKGGSFEELVKISLDLKSINDAKSYLKEKNVSSTRKPTSRPEVKGPRIFSSEILNQMLPLHDYWVDRGISLRVVREFGGGVIKEGRMKDRYVFPIFNSKKNLIGLSGRCILENRKQSRPKWKHLGDKGFWRFPLQLNYHEIKAEKELFLIESIGDALSLWAAGIKNFIVIFGLDASVPLLNSLIKIDPNKIYISLNNDSNNNSAGNLAAEKLERKLKKYFDPDQVGIRLPPKNDFGEMTREEILDWKEQLDA